MELKNHFFKNISSGIARTVGNLFFKRSKVLETLQKNSLIYCTKGAKNLKLYKDLKYQMTWEKRIEPPRDLVEAVRKKFSFSGVASEIFSGEPVKISGNIEIKIIPDTEQEDQLKIIAEITGEKTSNHHITNASKAVIFIKYNPDIFKDVELLNDAFKNRREIYCFS